MCAAAAPAPARPMPSIRRRWCRRCMRWSCPGGSAYGLDAASAVMSRLAAQGRGCADRRCDHPDRAICHPVRSGQWRRPRTGAMSRPIGGWPGQAMDALGTTVAEGNAGAGYGAKAGRLQGRPWHRIDRNRRRLYRGRAGGLQFLRYTRHPGHAVLLGLASRDQRRIRRAAAALSGEALHSRLHLHPRPPRRAGRGAGHHDRRGEGGRGDEEAGRAGRRRPRRRSGRPATPRSASSPSMRI